MDIENNETALNDKQRLFNLYLNAKTDEHGHISGQRMLIAKEYLRKFGTVLKEDIKTQYEPTEAPVPSVEVATIAQTVKVVQISPKEVIKKLDRPVVENKEVKTVVKKAKKENSPRITGDFISRLNGIFRFLESSDKTSKATLKVTVEQMEREYELKLKVYQQKDVETQAFVKTKNAQFDTAILLNEKLKKELDSKDQEIEKQKIENEILREQLTQLQQQRAK